MDELAKKCYRCDIFCQTGANSKPFAGTLAVLLCLGVLLIGCRPPRTFAGPSIELTKIPVSAVGGLGNMDTIEGRVIDFRPEQRIVLYAESGGRWRMRPL